MLVNYFKIAIRNLQKNMLFSFINILGMSISLASVFIIALFVNDELMFDKHITDADRKFRMYNYRVSDSGEAGNLAIVPYPMAAFLQKDFPEIESTLRIMDTFGENLFESDDKKMPEENGIYAEPSIGDMLSLTYIHGDSKTALEKVNHVVLTQTLAKKYFGDVDPVGRPIKISSADYAISGVIADPPSHLHLKVSYILSMASLTQNWSPFRFENWINQQYITYIKLKPGADADAFESKLPAFVEKYAYPKTRPEGFTYVPHIQSITDVHLYSSDFQWEIAQRGNAQTVYILIVTAGLILIIACLNFINLSTARSIKRMKEVGVRKVVGAYRSQLIFQFVTESIVITLISLAIAIAITEFTLPPLNTFTEKTISDPFGIVMLISLLGGSILLGFIAGSYPAFHLSKFKPARILSNKKGGEGGVELFRKSLVVLQFAFSFFLIISALIVIAQNDLLQNKDMGFNKEQLVVLKMTRQQLKNGEAIKHQFSDHPNVVSSALSYGLPGDIVAGDGITDAASGKNWGASMMMIDPNYISTMGMEVIAGSGFSPESPSGIKQGFVLNETAVKSFGYGTPEQALGTKINWTIWGKDSLKKGEVIGVIKDFHFRSLREKVAPVVMHVEPDYFWTLTLRIKPEGVQETIAHLKSTWEKTVIEWPFQYSFLDKNFDDMYRNERKLSALLTGFTGLAIFISCLGLFGLVEYSVNQRAKEISIRKIFGAGIPSLLMLLTRHYFLLITIAFIITIPLAYYTANEWLQNFAYHVEVNPLIFVKAGALILVITLATVIFQSLKAATSNPAKVLKNE
jgi:putative ABC transport system permease protein